MPGLVPGNALVMELTRSILRPRVDKSRDRATQHPYGRRWRDAFVLLDKARYLEPGYS